MTTDSYRAHYERHRDVIARRLREFQAVPPEEYIWELCYCLLTPGSRAVHAEQVVHELRRDRFLERRFDPTPYLRDPRHYIRFHNQKAARLLAMVDRREEITALLLAPSVSSIEMRDNLVGKVNGLGWKESSHFLRNIGRLDLAILDRHVLKHLHACGLIPRVVDSISSRRVYLEIEAEFARLAQRFGLTVQELDLLFWSLEEGSVRK